MKQILEHVHNPIEDSERGEKVCNICGEILEERTVNMEFDPVDIKNGMYFNLGQSTSMSADLKDVPRSERSNMLHMRKIDNHIKFDSNSNEKTRIERISGICEKLQLPQYFRIDFLQLASKAKQDGLTKGRTISEIDAGIMVYLCRRHGIPKSMKVIANAAGTKPGKVWNALRMISERYGELNVVQTPESYIPQFVSSAEMTFAHENEIMRILTTVKKDGKCEGKSPLVIIAAILLTVSRKSGNHFITQTRVAEIAGISSVAIKLMINKLKLNTV